MVQFYLCEHCHNLVTFLYDSGQVPVCCGDPMTRLEAKVEEAEGSEKHLPEIHQLEEKVFVNVGMYSHPMEKMHHICWIALETNKGLHIKWLKEGLTPSAEFRMEPTEYPVAAYAFCNIHGLWASPAD